MHAWQELGLLGEHPALWFVNTVDDAGKTRRESGIPDWPTLLAWAEVAGMVDADARAVLAAQTEAEQADAEVAAVHALREAAWALLRAHAAGVTDPVAPERLAGDLRWALDGATLVWDGQGWTWHADAAAFGSARVRAAVALAVEDLLRRGAELARLRECGRCAALFLDHGRGKGRRWCRMETCGNRAKAARHRART